VKKNEFPLEIVMNVAPASFFPFNHAFAIAVNDVVRAAMGEELKELEK
jgi:hypothetical protein